MLKLLLILIRTVLFATLLLFGSCAFFGALEVTKSVANSLNIQIVGFTESCMGAVAFLLLAIIPVYNYINKKPFLKILNLYRDLKWKHLILGNLVFIGWVFVQDKFYDNYNENTQQYE